MTCNLKIFQIIAKLVMIVRNKSVQIDILRKRPPPLPSTSYVTFPLGTSDHTHVPRICLFDNNLGSATRNRLQGIAGDVIPPGLRTGEI